MVNGSQKGSSFERATCKELSLWWSGNTNDDWFWRSSQSGGRATTRKKRGLSTTNAAGDICAMNHEAQRFLELCTLELKCGYTKATLSDLIEKDGKSEYHGFIEQARSSASLAGSPNWMLIHKRDRREALLLTNNELPIASRAIIPVIHTEQAYGGFEWVQVYRYADFLCESVREHFKAMADHYEGKRI
jgi:hypothetical protein